MTEIAEQSAANSEEISASSAEQLAIADNFSLYLTFRQKEAGKSPTSTHFF